MTTTPDLDEVAAALADRVWERFDVDLWEDFDPDGVFDAETQPDKYADLLVHFVSHLVDADALTAAAALRRSRENS